MNKAALVLAVAEQTGQTIATTTATVDAVLRTLVHTVANGEHVSLTGLGTLEPYIAPAYQARNPANNAPVMVPDMIRVRFRTADRLLAYANGAVPLPACAADVHMKAPKTPDPAVAPQSAMQGAS